MVCQLLQIVIRTLTLFSSSPISEQLERGHIFMDHSRMFHPSTPSIIFLLHQDHIHLELYPQLENSPPTMISPNKLTFQTLIFTTSITSNNQSEILAYNIICFEISSIFFHSHSFFFSSYTSYLYMHLLITQHHLQKIGRLQQTTLQNHIIFYKKHRNISSNYKQKFIK